MLEAGPVPVVRGLFCYSFLFFWGGLFSVSVICFDSLHLVLLLSLDSVMLELVRNTDIVVTTVKCNFMRTKASCRALTLR